MDRRDTVPLRHRRLPLDLEAASVNNQKSAKGQTGYMWLIFLDSLSAMQLLVACKDAFLPRDAMLARYMLYGPVSVRLCLSVKSVFYKNG